MGTPDFALPSLRALREAGHDVAAVVCQPDRPKGRGGKPAPPPVKVLAESWGLPVIQPEKMKDPSFLDRLRAYHPDLISVVAFGRILPPSILNLPSRGCVNVHASLLPKYRGAGPIAWAIINGESETGVTTMQMDPGMDTGDMLLQERIPILPEDTAGTLAVRLSELGARLLIRTLEGLAAGTVSPTPQDHSRATPAPILEKEAGELDWSQPASALVNRVRGLDPWPGAYTFYEDERWRICRAAAVENGDSAKPGTVLKADRDAISVATGEGVFQILELQPANGRRMPVRDFLGGHSVSEGRVLG